MENRVNEGTKSYSHSQMAENLSQDDAVAAGSALLESFVSARRSKSRNVSLDETMNSVNSSKYFDAIADGGSVVSSSSAFIFKIQFFSDIFIIH